MALSGQRAFVNKINKRGSAAEVRKQLTASTYLGEGNKNPIPLNLSLSSLQAIPLYDVADPPDFEECISQYQTFVERDPLQHLLDYPPDDLQVQVIKRKQRTVDPIVLEKGAESEKHVKDCLVAYTKDYCVINRKYEGCSNRHNEKEERCLALQEAAPPEYEISVPDVPRTLESLSRKSSYSSTSLASTSLDPSLNLDQSPADSLLPTLLDNLPPEEIDSINKNTRQHGRQDVLFALYPQQHEDEQIENRLPPVMTSDHVGHRLLLKCVQLKFDLEIEPIFASASLYDIRSQKKISENFYFDLSSEQQHKMIEAHVPFRDHSTTSKSAIFNITHPSSDIFLVVKLEKVLQQGEISEVAEPYIVRDEKSREKARSSAQFYCSRLGKYRMPFAWTAIHLLNIVGSSVPDIVIDNNKDSLRSDSLERNRPSLRSGFTPDKRHSWTSDEIGHAIDSFKSVNINISNFYKQESDKLSDDDLYKFLGEMKKQASILKKLKSIPGVLKMEISPCPQEVINVLTPDLNMVDGPVDKKARLTKEVLEFPIKDIYRPHNSYINLLYIYPKSLNFANRQGSSRNIAVKVQFMQGEGELCALPVIFGKSNCPEISKESCTAVNYHNKTPSFYEEVKVKLPAKLTDAHHLFFTFYHISCQPKKENLELETCVGYSWLPLSRDGRLVTGEFNLPVSLDHPPSHYHMLHPDVQLPSMKWVDNHKGLFNIVINSVSSIHTLDEYLDKFLLLVNSADDGKVPSKFNDVSFEGELKICIQDLTKASSGPLVQFVPLILDKLVQLLVRPPVVGGQVVNASQAAFEAMAHIVRRLQNIVDLPQDRHGRNLVLVSYINYSCTLQPQELSSISPTASSPAGSSTLGRPASSPGSKNARHMSSSDPDVSASNEKDASGREYAKFTGKKLVHDELTLQWLVSTGPTSNLALSNSWFFFELIVRSMEDYLGKAGKLDAPRKSRFSPQLLVDISSLVDMVTRKIVEACSGGSVKDPSKGKDWNSSLAFFIKSLLSIMDRGYVFKLIKIYCKVVNDALSSNNSSGFDVTQMSVFKLEFIRIVCSHEHYITLNLPFNLPNSTPSNPPSPTSSIASSASQGSLLSGNHSSYDRLPLTDLTNEYRSNHFLVGIVLSDLAAMLETSVPLLQNKAINILTNLLASHDMDPRYKSPEARARVAGLYLPLMKVVIDVLPQLFHPVSESRSRMMPETPGINQTVAMAIAGSASYNLASEPKKASLSQEATQDLLICFLWVLKNANQKLLWSWWLNLSFNKINQLLEVIYFTISNFEYKGKKMVRQYSVQPVAKKGVVDMKSKMEELMLGTSSARSEMIRRKHSESFGPFGENGSKLRWRKDQTYYRQSHDTTDGSKDDTSSFIEGLLSNEVGLIALDVMELIIQIIQTSDSLQNCLSQVLKVVLHSMSLSQSSSVLQNLFATQRSLVSKFPELLFEEDTEQCADLCLRLLKHCSSSLGNIRVHASASLYMLMRQNYEIGNNFARVKMQVTMSLSSLVGQSQACNEEYLRRSLKTILTYADNDLELKDTTFPDQVRDLVMNLHMILSDTIKMKEYESDPEMLLDLMYRIAKGYQNSPDLRLTWLHNMAAKHHEKKNYAEAGQCLVHAAGLVTEYLNMLEDKPYLPVGCVALQHVSRNVLEESAVSEDVLSPEEEGICQGKHFTESGLMGLLEQSVSFFENAGMYEAVNKVFKVLIPIYESNRDFKKLAHVHGKIQEAFNNIIKHDSKRMFGTYFRVGFYGSRFGDLDGKEYIYKEPAITKLSEVSHRLESFYSDKFGSSFVETIKDSNNVERSQLNPEKAYIQITYVEPHFDLYEMKDRQTFFEKNYNIKRFMYATPFTKDGKAHGDLKDQYKRKTILTTSHAFPYIKTRLQVINKESIVLTPIEVAIEDIQKKTKELALASKQEPPDAKMLQMVLQGCIGATVNQGPVEMATVFLSPVQDGEQLTKFHNKLRSCFKDFLKKCGDALHKNRGLIGPDQREYQQELEKNYHLTRDQLLALVSSRVHHSSLNQMRHRK